MDNLADLRQENELLRAEILQLKQQLGLSVDAEFIVRCKELFGMTRGQARLLHVLLSARTPHRETIFAAYCEHTDDIPDIKVLDAQICHIRRHLRPFGVAVETVWGQGYRISSDNQARLRGLLSIGAQAA